MWLDETRDLDTADVLELDDGPGCIILPAPWEHTPAGQRHWPAVVETEFAMFASRPQWRDPRFGGPVALDIALRGGAGQGIDLDNLGRTVLRAFSKAFKESKPDLSAYRVYRQAASETQIRVRLMPAVRLTVLAEAMGRARDVLDVDRMARTRH